ncbi:Golgi SNAP receptor complex member 1-like [Varroa jacobsoni]|uniref:Golgi SNAP receptor complex member 1 n=1 Tax=Varroa destructor TaxID=109461 RepID=A0A7M7JLE4_VARDE|nr:Golgi SNAP receptor complex member 1-like [Varroa destructor]XP_022653728.1 Golgi SNAP receptor complex member 1-like [Varroa destructor]XP_022699566.1 Golgi SNAP receptor complex member 1-like [Varroa jacobsoni]
MLQNWEELRKQARHLENEIDLKLVSFSKVGTSLGSRDFTHENSDTVPLLSSAASGHVVDSMTEEIEHLLSLLQQLNDDMSECEGGGSSRQHTLQRHRDILKDYTAEFNKTRNNIESRRQREELLGTSGRGDSASTDHKMKGAAASGGGVNRRADFYLKEHEHIRNSERLVSDQINIAIRTREELRNQRGTLKSMQTRVTTLANRFPVLNSLLQRIHIRKRRDSIILGLVIGTCTLLLLLYTFR